jgi:hypothetical protein
MGQHTHHPTQMMGRVLGSMAGHGGKALWHRGAGKGLEAAQTGRIGQWVEGVVWYAKHLFGDKNFVMC